jgi:hypothetical protein
VRGRRRAFADAGRKEAATDNLSFLAINGSFVAFFSFLVFSTATDPFAHYIFWSRIPACVLAILLLWEFRLDYPASMKAVAGPASCVLFLSALLGTILLPGVAPAFIKQLQIVVVVSGVVLVGGQVHQLWLLLSRRRVGALSLRARTLNLMKDLSTVAFGVTLGMHQSWSFVVVAAANAALTMLVIGVGMRLSPQKA